MKSLTELNLKPVYRSGKANLLEDFYLPALECCKYYDRAVGFFSTSLLSYALKGISSIVKSDGRMRLIVGHPLDEDEFEALKEGVGLQEVSSILCDELDRVIDGSSTAIEESRLQLFRLLIATNKLEMKFALKKNGMYHEKIGVIRDHFDNKILFTGSANETTNAINPDLNFESIVVYKNWEADDYRKYALEFEDGFESLWNGTDPNIITVDMPSDMYQSISEAYQKSSDIINNIDFDEVDLIEQLTLNKENHYPIIPGLLNGNKFSIFAHQRKALKNWFSHQKRGLFRLATGSGKTITSMYGIASIFDNSNRPRKMLVLIAVPYQTLADQWVRELSLFNMKPIQCYSSKLSWEEKLSDKITLLNAGVIEFMSVVVVNKTLGTERFNSLISRVKAENIFFVGDECHHHANENIRKYLPEAKMRIGLSATPYVDDEDWEYDDEPNTQKDILTEFYGNVVADYSLSHALADGILTPYKYYLVPVKLSEAETSEYLELSKEIARLISFDKSKDNTALSNAIRKRNKIINNASMKVNILDSLLKKNNFEDKKHTLFYVGEGTAITNDEFSLNSQDEVSQLSAISDVVVKNGWKPSKFTSRENASDRKKIMKNFVEGSIDALVSMRVLDEGIDIPQCKRAFILASSRNSRQFIQRRGRILRKSKGKDVAEIFDFIVLPNQEHTGNDAFKKLALRELKRVMDFVRLSANRIDCEREAQFIADDYSIDLREV